MASCACSRIEFGVVEDGAEGEAPTFSSYTTECHRTTGKIFAMGHDAKLVGFLVRAELAGEQIRMAGVAYFSAVTVAARFSDRLAAKAQAQLDAARARVAKKELAAATQKAKKSAAVAAEPTAEIRPEMAKVGRWTYEGTVASDTGAFTYTDKKGKTVVVPAGKWRLA